MEPGTDDCSTTPRPLRHAALVLLSYSALYTLLFAPVLFGGRVLLNGHDAYTYHYPALFGSRSLWEPLLGGGYPTFADPQLMRWYPLALPLSLSGWQWLWNPFLLSAYVLASAFTYGLVWRLTRSRTAAAVSGIIYGMSGFLMAHMLHVAILHAAAWVPLLLWALEELRTEVRRGWIVVLSLAVGNCFLAGHLQVFVYGCLLAGLYAVTAMVRAPAGGGRFALASAGGAVLGVALTAIQLLPTAELAPLSQRSELTFAEFVSFSLPRQQLPQLVFPFVYGGQDCSMDWVYQRDATDLPRDSFPYFGAWNFHELAGYGGILSLVLAVVGLLGGLRCRATWFWAGAAVLGVLLALGDATPLARALYRVPVVNCFRCPVRFLLWFQLGLAVLAGLGVARLAALPRPGSVACLAIATVAVVGLVVGLWWQVARQMPGRGPFAALAPVGVPAWVRSPWPWTNPALGWPLLAGLLGLGAVWAWAWQRRAVTAGLLVGAALLDLGTFSWNAGWRAGSVRPEDLACPRELLNLLAPLAARGERVLSTAAFWRPTKGMTSYGSAIHAETAPPNLTTLWGVPNAYVYTPLVLARCQRLILESLPHCNNKVPQLLAVRYLITPATLGTDANEPPAIREAGGPRPRAWLVGRVAALSAEQIAGLILRNDKLPDGNEFDPYKMALVEEGVPFTSEQDDPTAAVVVERHTPCRVQVRTRSACKTFLVLGDVNYPGWEAHVDGQATKIYQTDYVLRGVVVPEGEHVVEFVFRPRSFYLGLAVSLAGLLTLLGIAVRRR